MERQVKGGGKAVRMGEAVIMVIQTSQIDGEKKPSRSLDTWKP